MRHALFQTGTNQGPLCALDSRVRRMRRSRNPRGRIRANEVQHLLGNPILKSIPQARVHGQGEDIGSSSFAHREIPSPVTEMRVCFLQVKGDGVVNSRTNADLSEMLLKCIAVLNSDHVKMVNCLCPGRLVGKAYFRVC